MHSCHIRGGGGGREKPHHYSTTTQGYTIYNIVAIHNGIIQIYDLKHGIKGHMQVNICVQTRQGRKKTERKREKLDSVT